MNDVTNFINENTFRLDTSTSAAFGDIVESKWKFNIYSVMREYVLKSSAESVFDYFINRYPNMQYRVFYGNTVYLWTDNFSVRFRGELMEPDTVINNKFDDQIVFSGSYAWVRQVVRDFDQAFKDVIVPEHHIVDMIIKGNHGLDKITLPIKTDRKFYPELYPTIDNPRHFINDFLTSTSNVLILIGPPGLGKSALINEIILSARVPTQIVFDKEVMRTDQLYTNFINTTLRENGGLMIMEDADNILSDRVIANNDMMSRLLNLSDGIVNTSGAKFVFSANIKSKDDIDSALVRPGRCYDVIEFRNLTLEEAEIAAKAIGKELYTTKKDDYTVAEIFNGKSNTKQKRKVGFV